MWDQGSKGWDQRSEGWDLGSQPRDKASQTMGSESAVFSGIRDQAVPYLWDQGRKLATLLESRIRNLRTKNGISDEKNTPRYHPGMRDKGKYLMYVKKRHLNFNKKNVKE